MNAVATTTLVVMFVACIVAAIAWGYEVGWFGSVFWGAASLFPLGALVFYYHLGGLA